MIFSRVFIHGLVVAALLAVAGCVPPGSGSTDEQKDPYYLSGKRRVNSYDYQGAIEDFEKALEVNPHSAAAHLELGILHEQRTKDYSAAIYHFERFLKYRPDSDFAEPVRQRILSCKQELARTVSLGPVNQSMQRDLEQLDKLTKENAQLKQQTEQLQSQIAQLIAMQLAAQRGQTNTVRIPAPVSNSVPTTGSRTVTPLPPSNAKQTYASAAVTPAASSHTYTIRSGDTFYSVAKHYGVSQSALQAANPGLDPRRLKLGQTLQVPAR